MATDYEISDLEKLDIGLIISLTGKDSGQKIRVRYLGPGAEAGSIKARIISTGHEMEFKNVKDKFDITISSGDPDLKGRIILGGSRRRAYGGRKRKTRCKKSSKRRCRKSSRRRR
jgi:hypothetical protein